MVAAFTNPRLSSLPAERMRASLIFSDDFVSDERVEENAGVISGAVIERGATFGGADSITYKPIEHQAGIVSVIAEIKTSTGGIIFTNSATNGFYLYVATGFVHLVTVNSSVLTLTSKAVDVLDGELHTITAVMNGGISSLYVDALEVETGVSTVTASSTNVYVGMGFTGTISKVRVYNEALTESDHLNYYNNNISSFMGDALAVWRCDSVGDDTVGNKIWDKQETLLDLYKGDQTTASTFPTFDTDKYEFDYSDDYISNVPTLPTDYTVSAVVQNPYSYEKTIRQENDETLLTELSTAGLFFGNLHNIILHSGVLTAFQLLHTKYQQLYYINKGYAQGIYSRLTNEGTAKAFFNLGRSLFNWSTGGVGVGTGITQTADGVTFDSSSSNITVADKSDLRIENGTIVFFGDLTGTVTGTKALISKPSNYELTNTSTYISFNGSSIARVLSGNKQLAVTFRSGFAPMFYIDGLYIGDGDTVETITSSGTYDLIIGNVTALNANCPYELNHVYVGNEPLTAEEILAMFNQSLELEISPAITPIIIQSTVGASLVLQSTKDGDPILQSTVE